jgi:hypothetical protein
LPEGGRGFAVCDHEGDVKLTILHPSPPWGERGLVSRRMNARGQVRIRQYCFDPLTRLAPAGESAGCEPPSPPRGRGQWIENDTRNSPKGDTDTHHKCRNSSGRRSLPARLAAQPHLIPGWINCSLGQLGHGLPLQFEIFTLTLNAGHRDSCFIIRNS